MDIIPTNKKIPAYAAKPLVVCSLPLRQPKEKNGKLQTLYKRLSGEFVFEMVSHQEHGLPFGRDRRLLLWAKTRSVQIKSPRVPFKTAVSLLEELGMKKTGGNLTWLKQSLLRLHKTAIYFGRENEGRVTSSGSLIFDTVNANFLKKTRTNPGQENYIVLSPAFYQSKAVPLDLKVVREFGDNYGALDLYTWLVWRWFTMRKSEATMVKFPMIELKKHLGSPDTATEAHFREKLKHWLTEVDRVFLLTTGTPTGVHLENGNICIPVRVLENVVERRKQLSFTEMFRRKGLISE